MPQTARRGLLALIVFCALALRLWGIGFGLPELYHPDEPAYVLQALGVGRGLPDGLTFANPPLFKYLLLAEYAVAYAFERVTGQSHSAAEFVEHFHADPSLRYLMARVTSAVVGALTALAAAALGNQVGGTRVGLAAGGLCGVSFLLVREAHFGVDDTLLALLVTLGLIACVRVFRCARQRDYVAAGALSGLAFAAKYDGIALLAPLVLAHLLRRDRPPIRSLGLAFGACVVAAILAFPSLVTEPGRVLNDIYVHLYLEASGGYDGLDSAGGYPFYARTLAIGLGGPLLLASAAGIGLSAYRKSRISLIVIALPFAMLLVLGSQQLYFARFALPTLPALIVEASLAIDALISWQLVVGLSALLVVAVPTLVDSVRFDALMTRTDTRTLAQQWLPTPAVFAADAPPLGPPLPQADNAAAGQDAVYDASLDEYRARGVEYLVTSSFTADARAIDPLREARRQAFNASLAQLTPVVQFSPGDVDFAYDQIYGPYTQLDRLQRPGPVIRIYRLTR